MNVPITQSCLTLCDPIDCSLPWSPLQGTSQQKYWSGFPFLPPRDLSVSGINPMSPLSPELQADSFPLSHLFPLKPNMIERRGVIKF